MAAAPAMASKARVTALGSPESNIDVQTIFENPGDLHYLGDFATLEFGSTSKGEGGFVRTVSFGKVGAYLGHKNTTVSKFVELGSNLSGLVDGSALADEQNPIDLLYGTELNGMKWGFDFHYSNAKTENVKTTPSTLQTKKESTAGISAGVRNDVWNAWAHIGLNGKTENNSTKTTSLESKGLYRVGGGYWMDTIYTFANYELANGTLTDGGSDTDFTKNAFELGMVNNHKVDGGLFFYGVSYLNSDVKVEKAHSGTVSNSGIPFLIGLEIEAASWMTLRGSVKQTVLIGEEKNEFIPNPASVAGQVRSATLRNDTTVSAGVGFKWNKITMDATLAGATSGNVNGNELLANSSLTYNF